MLALSAVLLGVWLAVWAAPAVAFTGYAEPVFFGSPGSGNGQFTEPAGVAVNDATGEVYVYDAGNARVQRFDATGSKFEGQFNGAGSPSGPFMVPASVSADAAHGTLFNIAVDNDPASPSAGDVYVVDPGHDVVDKFSAAGGYLAQLTGFTAPIFGVALDKTGKVWVAEEGRGGPSGNTGPVQEFDNAQVNKHLLTLDPEKLRSPGIAVDSEEDLYLLRGEPEIVKFSKEGRFLEEVGCECVTALAVNAATNELLADEKGAIVRYGPFGHPVEQRVEGVSGSYGVAVNANTTTMYASQRESGTVGVFAFGLLPDVTTGSGQPQRTTVTLAGEVNPDGQPVTSCQFQYGTTPTALGSSVACTPASPGSGTSPVPVSAQITGLTPQTIYHYRLVAGNGTGAHGGEQQTVTTLPAVQGLTTLPASEPLATTATLNGSLETTGMDTHYLFQYGTSETYDASTALTDGGSTPGTTTVNTPVNGLTPHQEYHYRILATNELGTTTAQDTTFKTGVLAPQISGSPTTEAVGSQSADVSALVNPEHTSTRYQFEYGPCATLTGCAQATTTPAETSGVYGVIHASTELADLHAATTYSYRLSADNTLEEEGQQLGGKTTGAEGTFTTATLPIPTLQTGPGTALDPTTATISGTVYPNGAPTSYAFELGIYNGQNTQYGTVAAGSAGSSTTPLPVTTTLTGLQPATTYAYRLAITSGYLTTTGGTLQGAPGTFTTPGLPAAITTPPLLPQLPTPPIPLPNQTRHATQGASKCKKDHTRNRHGKCVRRPHKKSGRNAKKARGLGNPTHRGHAGRGSQS